MPEGDMKEAMQFKADQAAAATIELPRYRCHKEVHALHIREVYDPTKEGSESDGSRILVPWDGRYAPFRVDRDYVHKHKPEADGFFVLYEDGYKSFSPRKAFQDGYTLIS